MREATRVGFVGRVWQVLGPWSLLLAALLFASPRCPAQAGPAPPDAKEPAGQELVSGLFITVRTPLTSDVVNRIQAKTSRFLQRQDKNGRKTVKIVYDFNPDGRASSTSDYGPCHDLAEFLLDHQSITTVAFVHNEVTGHTVLPVLACKEIVMSSDGKLGDAWRGQNKPLRKDILGFYEEVATSRGRPPALILRMLDKGMSVVEGTLHGAPWYVDERQLAQEKQKGFVDIRPASVPMLYTTGQAQHFGLCHLTAETRQDLAQVYQLPVNSLREDPLEGRTPNAWRIEVRGAITLGLKETVERRIRKVIHQGANLIVLQLQCGAGDPQVASDLADFLSSLKDDQNEYPIMTVAYVTERARSTAAFLAFGCTEIVMNKKAQLGGFDAIVQERPQYQQAIFDQLDALVRKQGYPPLLARGMLFPEDSIHRVRSRKGQVERRLITGAELRKDKTGPQKWVDEGLLKPDGEFFSLGADRAVELGVAQLKVQGPPEEAINEIAKYYGLEKVHSAGPDWLDEVAAFLRLPLVSVFLVMIGITGLILELKMPGVGFPGVVAALCFVLYFWAHSQLAGNLWWLAILLFVLGLILIGLEIFVVPGLGITGVSGIALMVVSLALATLVKKPETTREWLDFGATLSTLGISLVGAIIFALVLAWYLPHIPYVNRLVLAPPSEQTEMLEGEESAGVPESTAALLGAIGEAATTLRPAGKARFGDEFVDVVAEGSFVEAGTRIQVIEIEGNRVVVKQV